MNTRLILAIIFLIGGCAQLPPVEVPEPPKPQALAVVFDIDGTLTPNVTSIAEARPDAAKAVHRYAEKGYKVIYLSTRLSFLQTGIPNWLKDNGFPASMLHVAQTDSDHKFPEIFKARIMKEYTARGWRLVGGYGDSSTDFEAYADAGIPKSRVFALLRRGDTACQPGQWQGCLRGWTEHLNYIDSRLD